MSDCNIQSVSTSNTALIAHYHRFLLAKSSCSRACPCPCFATKSASHGGRLIKSSSTRLPFSSAQTSSRCTCQKSHKFQRKYADVSRTARTIELQMARMREAARHRRRRRSRFGRGGQSAIQRAEMVCMGSNWAMRMVMGQKRAVADNHRLCPQLRKDPDRQDHHPRGRVERHHRQRKEQDPG